MKKVYLHSEQFGDRLATLIERLERAGEGCRELDCEVAVAALGFFELPPKWEGGPVGYGYIDKDGAEVRPGHGGDQLVPRLTTSLDAALRLVPEGWRIITLGETEIADIPPWEVRLGKRGVAFGRARAITVVAATPALALTIASLRAREAMKGEG